MRDRWRPGERGRGLEHVLWLSGGAGAGKTTTADALARHLSWDVYHYHERTRDHVNRSTPESQPMLHQFLNMDMNERWLNRAPAEMLRTLPETHGERITFVVQDLRKLAADRPVIVEGWGLLPRFVAPYLSNANQALWLIPSEEFCAVALKAREDLWTIPNKTSDPQRARNNWLEREKLLVREMATQAHSLGLRVVEVDKQSLNEVCLLVEQHFLSYATSVTTNARRSS